ncbi:MAG: Gfo/Idh/MocA family oxidoreductase [Ruminococcaceae bacterium]|nr:Gfo/Idh/MocA family oxidoreductase [Oscillospiraceae bacterium]
MKVGIIGAGGIARKMAQTLSHMTEAEAYAIASRSADKAEAFAKQYGLARPYGSYEALLEDDAVDLVYIALPHSHHCEWTLAALDAGKHVLCEKAFAANAAQTRQMLARAREKKRLLAEAIWTRYMPSRALIDEVVASGRLGKVAALNANLGYRIDAHERIVRPELAGGALLDLTVYPLNFAAMVLGGGIERMEASCVMTDTGVDGADNVLLTYEGGQAASLFTTIYALTDRRGMVYGAEGFLEVENINNPRALRIWSADRDNPQLLETIDVPAQISGYEYEVLACRRAIEAGALECPEMPHAETLRIMEQMDAIRAGFGIVFPFE